MAKFMIEVPHEADTVACARVVQTFLSSGSHFLSQAEWGCTDGVHSCWMIVDMENKDEARAVIPAAFRDAARIVRVTRFTLPKIEETLRRHGVSVNPGRPDGA
jgi:hypothetical protein